MIGDSVSNPFPYESSYVYPYHLSWNSWQQFIADLLMHTIITLVNKNKSHESMMLVLGWRIDQHISEFQHIRSVPKKQACLLCFQVSIKQG